MNPITDIWKQLVRRRLWPVALLLVGALAAVPYVLAKDPEPVPPASVTPANTETASAELATDPIVSPAAPADASNDRKPIGKHHDIFKPTKKAPKPAKAAKKDDTGDAVTDKPADSGKSGSGGSTGGSTGGGASPTTPVTPTTPVEPVKPKTYPLYSLKVKFGGSDGSSKQIVPKLSALPSADEPLVVYLGLLDDKKTAVFMLDSTLQAIGDGKCHPSPENCETVRMREGDTMFFDVVGPDGKPAGAQYELELLDINKKQTTDAAKSAKSAKLAKVASAAAVGGGLGRESLRRLGVIGRTG
jgi:hypothetical protein